MILKYIATEKKTHLNLCGGEKNIFNMRPPLYLIHHPIPPQIHPDITYKKNYTEGIYIRTQQIVLNHPNRTKKIIGIYYIFYRQTATFPAELNYYRLLDYKLFR